MDGDVKVALVCPDYLLLNPIDLALGQTFLARQCTQATLVKMKKKRNMRRPITTRRRTSTGSENFIMSAGMMAIIGIISDAR